MAGLKERLGLNMHLANDPRLWQAAAALGISWCRIDANWPTVQPTSASDWEWDVIDRAIDGALAVGLKVYASLAHSPDWTNQGRGRGVMPIFIGDWLTFVHAVAERYQGKIAAYGVWNEYKGTAEDYATYLFRPAHEVLKRVNPQAPVCGPDIETERDWPTWLTTFLKIAGEETDVITVHAYEHRGGRAVWEKLTRERSWFEQAILRRSPSIKQVIDAAGYGHKPCWVTETGSQADETTQAQFYDELLERLQSASWPHGVLAYQMIDEEPPDREPVRFGVLRVDQSWKPAAHVIQMACQPPMRVV